MNEKDKAADAKAAAIMDCERMRAWERRAPLRWLVAGVSNVVALILVYAIFTGFHAVQKQTQLLESQISMTKDLTESVRLQSVQLSELSREIKAIRERGK